MSQLKYLQEAQAFIRDALNLIRHGAKEARVRDNFTSYLRHMFPPDTKWVDRHIQEAETPVRLNRQGRLVSGFIDNCIDYIAIEYEKDLNKQAVFDEGLRQVKEYTAAFLNQGVDKDIVVGILSDTLNWYVYKVEGLLLSLGNYTDDNIKLRQVDELHIKDDSPVSAERLLEFLRKHLGKVGGRELTAEALSKDFGLDSKYTGPYITAILEYVDTSISNNREYYTLLRPCGVLSLM